MGIFDKKKTDQDAQADQTADASKPVAGGDSQHTDGPPTEQSMKQEPNKTTTPDTTVEPLRKDETQTAEALESARKQGDPAIHDADLKRGFPTPEGRDLNTPHDEHNRLENPAEVRGPMPDASKVPPELTPYKLPVKK